MADNIPSDTEPQVEAYVRAMGFCSRRTPPPILSNNINLEHMWWLTAYTNGNNQDVVCLQHAKRGFVVETDIGTAREIKFIDDMFAHGIEPIGYTCFSCNTYLQINFYAGATLTRYNITISFEEIRRALDDDGVQVDEMPHELKIGDERSNHLE